MLLIGYVSLLELLLLNLTEKKIGTLALRYFLVNYFLATGNDRSIILDAKHFPSAYFGYQTAVLPQKACCHILNLLKLAKSTVVF